MAHISPAVYLVWALLTVMLGSFLVFHLWSFDRFKCLKWNQGPHSGAFKRVMTYSYILSIPFIITYAVGFAIIKYNYDFTVIPQVGIIPTPYELWGPSAQSAVLPLYLSLSIGWSLEMVTHLEGTRVDALTLFAGLSAENFFIELCFWLFLVNSGSAQQDWFRSLYFKIWAVGSGVAVLAMPLIAIFTRENVYKCEAYTFLTGGLLSLSLTIWFLPILWTFSSFIANLKMSGVEMPTLIRLTKYHELNCVRVVFRFLFTIPLVILGVDGVRPHQHINDKMFPTDLLGIVAAVGVVVSSGITLVIFFPRSIECEMTQKERQRMRRRQRAQQSIAGWDRVHSMQPLDDDQSYISVTQQSKIELEHHDLFVAHNSLESHDASVGMSAAGLPAYDMMAEPSRPGDHARVPSIKRAVLDNKSVPMGSLGGSFSLKPNRRTLAGGVEFGAVLSKSEVELARARSQRDQNVSSLVHQWRSPIEIGRPAVSRWRHQVP